MRGAVGVVGDRRGRGRDRSHAQRRGGRDVGERRCPRRSGTTIAAPAGARRWRGRPTTRRRGRGSRRRRRRSRRRGRRRGSPSSPTACCAPTSPRRLARCSGRRDQPARVAVRAPPVGGGEVDRLGELPLVRAPHTAARYAAPCQRPTDVQTYNQMVVGTPPTESGTDRLFPALADATRRDIVRCADAGRALRVDARPPLPDELRRRAEARGRARAGRRRDQATLRPGAARERRRRHASAAPATLLDAGRGAVAGPHRPHRRPARRRPRHRSDIP